jgi:DNA-binding CsgD family transcriptional regulator
LPKSRNEEEIWQITKRLDAILNVLLEIASTPSKPITSTKKIAILYSAGLRPIEISKILGKSLSYVTKELTRMRKKGD